MVHYVDNGLDENDVYFLELGSEFQICVVEFIAFGMRNNVVFGWLDELVFYEFLIGIAKRFEDFVAIGFVMCEE